MAESLALNQKGLHRLRELGHADLFERYELVAAQIAEIINNPWGVRQSPQMPNLAKDTGVASLRETLRHVIDAVRAVPGYEDFLQPVGFREIQDIARNCTIVYLISTSKGGLGIAIEKGTSSICTVAMDAMTQAWAQESVLKLVLLAEGIKKGTNSRLDFIKFVEELTAEIGICLAPLSSTELITSHIVIIPVGLLALLPLHAAQEGDRYLLDRCLVSFSPNARSLLTPAMEARSRPESLLAIATPEVGLRYTADEIALIETYFEQARVLTGTEATAENARNEVYGHSVLHFSCHASADLLQPLRSALHLHGGRLTLSDLLMTRFRNVNMAVMSACESGVPGLAMPEEIVNLPSALLQGGVRSIISTLWIVEDATAAMLMIRFYHNWRQQGQDALAALVQAQKWIRDTTNSEKAQFFGRQGAQELTQYLTTKEPRAQAHKSPWHWAGFTWTGTR